MAAREAEVVVIGSGPGGYVAAFRASQLGKKVIMIEGEKLGGVCLNVGCIPSKAVITASKHYEHAQKKFDEIGIITNGVSLDFTKLQAWKEKVVNKHTSGIGSLAKGFKVEVIAGFATLKKAGPPTLISVQTKEGVIEILAKDVILAAGSRPATLPHLPIDEKDVVSSTGALAFTEVPKRLLVIGAGYIGLELGTAYAKLGSQVIMVELMDQVLPGFDPDFPKILTRRLKKNGVTTHLKTKVVSIEKRNGEISARLEGEFSGEIVVDKVLVTVGRKPNSDRLGLENVGVKVNPKGFIEVDEKRRTNIPGIYAIGDLTPGPGLAHKASKEGEVAAEVIAGHKAAFDVRCIPAVAFVDPEVSVVGFSEAEAKAAGRQVKVASFPFAANARATTSQDIEGMVKLISDAKTGELLGAGICGHEASNLISELALAIEMGADVEDVALTIHPHPTLSEAVMEAAKESIGANVHTVKPSRA
jgi:dihydrolipoamide dehydrogenase